MVLVFDIEFRQQEGEKDELFGAPIQRIEKSPLDGLDNIIYDYLYSGYEMWVRRVDCQPLSQIEIEYVLRTEAENMIEDGWPLGWRMLKDALVIWQNQSVQPFGRKAHDFYTKYTNDPDVKNWTELKREKC